MGLVIGFEATGEGDGLLPAVKGGGKILEGGGGNDGVSFEVPEKKGCFQRMAAEALER